MTNVACYIRVSTVEQAEEGYSIGAQKERLTAYCKARDWLVYDYYVDGGFSGSNIDRPAMQKLINDVKSKKIDAVLVYKLDRLSRSQKDTLLLIEDVFNKYDVSFVSINENFDTSTAFGRAMVGILSVFAQLEREQIKERMNMGRVARAQEGLFHGGGYIPIGYDYVDGELKINDYEALQVRELFDLFLKGESINSIRDILHSKYTNKYGSWYSTSSVVSTLVTPIYKGKVTFGGEVYDGAHDPIVDEKTFDKAYERYEEIRWNKKDSKVKRVPFNAKHLLTGLVHCGNCEARYFAMGNYSGHGDKKKYFPYYTCYSRAKSNKRMIKDHNCLNKSYSVRYLDEMIIAEIKKLTYNPSIILELQSQEEPMEPRNDNQILENRIAEIEKQINRTIDLYQLGTIPFSQITERINKLKQEQDNLVSQIVEVNETPQKMSYVDAEILLSTAHAILDSDDLKKKRELVHSLIDKIVLIGEDIEIRWAFA